MARQASRMFLGPHAPASASALKQDYSDNFWFFRYLNQRQTLDDNYCLIPTMGYHRSTCFASASTSRSRLHEAIPLAISWLRPRTASRHDDQSSKIFVRRGGCLRSLMIIVRLSMLPLRKLESDYFLTA